ncbi:MAG: bifunctional oligoribonuclease/PAP phosphatase NrnA [Nitrospirota bacterium]
MKISSKLLSLIRQNSSFLIVGHINPEADSLGASLALCLGLKKLGKKDVCVLSRDPVPETLKFLPSSKIVRQKPPSREYDVVFLVDCNEVKRTGFEGFRAKKTAVIDHHVLSADAAASEFYESLSASLIDPGAAAAGLLVYRVLDALRVPIDKNIAALLYTAILTDTGGFRYSNSSSEALKTAAHLVEAGAKPWDISKAVYESIPYKSMKLLGLCLATLERKDGIAWISATRHMFDKTGTTAEDSEDFVDFPRKLKDNEVAVFFRQDGSNSYKLSLRSKGRVNVQKIARSFGGGGHVAAAGCKIKGTLKEVQDKVFTAIRKEITQVKK